MLITFEGIDGSGKSTQATLLVDALRAMDREVVFVREPGGTEVGERIRSVLLDAGGRVAPVAELMLFCAARAQLAEDVIRPALRAGKVVVADRFYDSTTAYQGGGRALFEPEWMEELHSRVTGGLVPDVTIYMDVPVELAQARLAGRSADRMESGGGQFFERVRTAYLNLAARHTNRFVVLDGTAPVAEVQSQILAHVTGRLPSADLD